jgi:hypothetical protein
MSHHGVWNNFEEFCEVWR